MKSTNIFASLLLIGAVVASGSAAHAGAGGAAGSVAVQFTGSGATLAPTQLSSSIAVGKQSAATTARTAAGVTFTSAFGTAAPLTLNDASKDTANYVAGSEGTTTLILNQANALVGPSGYSLTPAGATASIPY
jgi:hypothetical protein